MAKGEGILRILRWRNVREEPYPRWQGGWRATEGDGRFQESRRHGQGLPNRHADFKLLGFLHDLLPVNQPGRSSLVNIHKPLQASPFVVRGMDREVEKLPFRAE